MLSRKLMAAAACMTEAASADTMADAGLVRAGCLPRSLVCDVPSSPLHSHPSDLSRVFSSGLSCSVLSSAGLFCSYASCFSSFVLFCSYALRNPSYSTVALLY